MLFITFTLPVVGHTHSLCETSYSKTTITTRTVRIALSRKGRTYSIGI